MQGPAVPHLPVNQIRENASDGCPFCTCLIANAEVDWLLSTILETRQTTLRRAIIDSQQALALSVDMDDVSHTHFFRIPSIWCKYILKQYLTHASPNLTFCSASSARKARTAMSRRRPDVFLDERVHPKPSTVLEQCGEIFRADAPP
jgi:hypothetical protein